MVEQGRMGKRITRARLRAARTALYAAQRQHGAQQSPRARRRVVARLARSVRSSASTLARRW